MAKYKCEICGGVFVEGWSKEEAQAEYLANFGKEIVENDEGHVVCDTCFKQFDPKTHPIALAKAKSEFYNNRN